MCQLLLCSINRKEYAPLKHHVISAVGPALSITTLRVYQYVALRAAFSYRFSIFMLHFPVIIGFINHLSSLVEESLTLKRGGRGPSCSFCHTNINHAVLELN